ncbi:MAG: DUF3025 domain-containing protein [Pseudomonadota bacterium]
MTDKSQTTGGLLQDFEQLFPLSHWRRPPGCAELNDLWPEHAPRSRGGSLRFVVQDDTLPFPTLSYAQRIATHGLIATRPDNWHDLFNALTWVQFPRTKLALTERLADPAGTRDGRNRTPEHNALTLFDECGVVLASTDPAFKAMHTAHDWRRLFVTHRADFGRTIRPVVFGHGLADQARSPYVGLTAKAWYLPVGDAWMAQSLATRYAQVDERLAFSLPGTLTSPRQLLPLPVLGVPGWWDANRDPALS